MKLPLPVNFLNISANFLFANIIPPNIITVETFFDNGKLVQYFSFNQIVHFQGKTRNNKNNPLNRINKILQITLVQIEL